MEQIAFISGGTFLYWSALVMSLGILAAVCVYTALRLDDGEEISAVGITVPLCVITSLVLSRLIHWYCRTDSYESLLTAMTDYSQGGYALMGTFGACALCACLLRLVKILKNLPGTLDAMALAGGVGIAVGRMASLFNASDRGVPVGENWGLPFAYAVTNPVSAVVENRLATFALQAAVTALIAGRLLVYRGVGKVRRKPLRDGDICVLFLASYGGSQIVLDSTRYDSLFLRSNGFVSIVQILGAVALVGGIVFFSVRMVKKQGMKGWFFAIWTAILALLGGAGYMEYHVQRHGDQALFAYSVMASCIIAALAGLIIIRTLAEGARMTQTESVQS